MTKQCDCQPGDMDGREADVLVLFRRGLRTKCVCHIQSHEKYPGTRCKAAARTLPLGTSASESDSSTIYTSHIHVYKCDIRLSEQNWAKIKVLLQQSLRVWMTCCTQNVNEPYSDRKSKRCLEKVSRDRVHYGSKTIFAAGRRNMQVMSEWVEFYITLHN